MEDEEKPIKVNKNSRLIISEDDGLELVTDIFGRQGKRRKLKKYVADLEVNLGSIMEPNKKIVGYFYDVPRSMR